MDKKFFGGHYGIYGSWRINGDVNGSQRKAGVSVA